MPPEDPLTAIFQALTCALPFALRLIVASFLSFGMLTPLCEVIPGGLKTIWSPMGAVNPSFRSATILSAIDPLRTMGTLGSTIRSLNGASSVTATARPFSVWFRYTDCPGLPTRRSMPIRNPPEMFFFSSTWLARTSQIFPDSGASAAASKRTGMVVRFAGMFSP